jgi:serine protease Do
MNAPLQRFRTRRLASTFTILATLSAGILIGSVVAHGVHGQDKTVDTRDATPLTIPDPRNLSTTFTQIVKEVGPAVVNINTEELPKEQQNARRGRGGMMQPQPQGPDDNQGGGDDNGDQGQGGSDQGGGDNGLQDFFNRFFGGMPGQGGGDAQQQERRALGSGFIVDPRGYIVTNNHVVDKADRIYVKLTTDPENDQGHRATVIGVDKDTDLAVIKIDVGHALPTIKLGNSDGTQVGDWVEAIGSPFDLSQTVTAGIISAKNRTIPGGGPDTQFQRFLQTDAAINPGNSGGPLLDMAGEVIGVNAAIYANATMGGEAGNMGIGFAIPANTVANVYNQLIGPEHKVIRGSIGIQFQANITSAVAKMYDASTGVLISAVTPGMPADKAGLKPNDVIVSIDGQTIKNGDSLVENISARHPGSTVSLGYLRNGQKMTATVTIADRSLTVAAINGPGANQGNPTPNNPGPSASQTKLGLTVSDLPPNAPSGFHGVIIQSVKPGSFADELGSDGSPGLQPGIIIESINRKPIHDKAEFDSIVATLHSGSDVVFEVAFPRSGSHTTSLIGGTLP